MLVSELRCARYTVLQRDLIMTLNEAHSVWLGSQSMGGLQNAYSNDEHAAFNS